MGFELIAFRLATRPLCHWPHESINTIHVKLQLVTGDGEGQNMRSKHSPYISRTASAGSETLRAVSPAEVRYWAAAITVYSGWHCYSNTAAPQHVPHTCNVYFGFLWLTLRLFPISSLQLFVKINYTQHGLYWVSCRFWHTGCRTVVWLARAFKYCELWIDPQCMLYNAKKYGCVCEMYSFWPEMIQNKSLS